MTSPSSSTRSWPMPDPPEPPWSWIAFDAVGTLMTPLPNVAQVYQQIGAKFGSRLGLDEVRERFGRVFRQTERNDLATADAPGALVTSEAAERDRWRRIVSEVLDDVSDVDQCFDELFVHFSRPEAWVCYPDVGPGLAALQTMGIRFVMASNFDSRLRSVVAGMPELRGVERLVISSEVGERKPGAAFFSALLAATGEPAERVLMVGDDVDNDILGARRAGLAAVCIHRKPPTMPGAISSLAELVELVRARL